MTSTTSDVCSLPGPDIEAWIHGAARRDASVSVASVSKKYFTWADTYGIDIPHGEDPILILSSAVVIDLCCHQDQK